MAFRCRPVFLSGFWTPLFIFISCQSVITVKKCQTELSVVLLFVRCVVP